MLLKIIAIAAVLIAVVLGYAATRPDTFSVQRSLTIQAPPAKIFALINDFHNWGNWAPQDKEDPIMRRTYKGPPQGTGAISGWASGGSAGVGRMEITQSLPPNRISIKVDFVKPFEAHNVNEFDLEPEGTSTRVTWSMRGTNLYIMKIMGIFMDMDKVAGKHFETGLSNLRDIAEK